MAQFRERPYGRFNYLVSWDELDPGTAQAGFSEVSGLGVEVEVIEYRAGNDKINAPRKVTGTYRVPDVTLKRGVLGADDLFKWIDAVRDGEQGQTRTVTIRLMSEDRSEIAATWKLLYARPVKYTGPTLNAKSGGEVAMEELTLACEGIEFE